MKVYEYLLALIIYLPFHCDINFIYTDANSKRVKEIEEVLKHEPGALCSLLETFQEAEISITIIDS